MSTATAAAAGRTAAVASISWQFNMSPPANERLQHMDKSSRQRQNDCVCHIPSVALNLTVVRRCRDPDTSSSVVVEYTSSTTDRTIDCYDHTVTTRAPSSILSVGERRDSDGRSQRGGEASVCRRSVGQPSW